MSILERLRVAGLKWYGHEERREKSHVLKRVLRSRIAGKGKRGATQEET